MNIAFDKEHGTINQRIQKTIDAVVDYATSCGALVEDAEKFRLLFRGLNPACWLVTPNVYIAHLPTVCEEIGIGTNELTGNLTVNPQGKKPYTIEIDPTKEQNLFMVCVERLGTHDLKAEETSLFPSFYLVCPETKGPLALAIAMEGTNDGTNRNLEYARRMYYSTERLAGGRVQTVDALRTIEGKQNLEALCFEVCRRSGFPMEKVRKNRQNSEERRQSWVERSTTFNAQRPQVGAGIGRSTVSSSLDSDPYATE